MHTNESAKFKGESLLILFGVLILYTVNNPGGQIALCMKNPSKVYMRAKSEQEQYVNLADK